MGIPVFEYSIFSINLDTNSFLVFAHIINGILSFIKSPIVFVDS